MLSFNSKKIAVLLGSGLLAIAPVGMVAQKATAAERLEPNVSQGIDANAIAQVYIIDNEAIPTGDLSVEPQAYVSPSDGDISLTVVNTTNSQIQYLFPNSEYRVLQPGESIVFNSWELPNQIGIQQMDGGLTAVDRIVVSDNGESARVELAPTSSFGQSITGLTFNENGSVYLAS